MSAKKLPSSNQEVAIVSSITMNATQKIRSLFECGTSRARIADLLTHKDGSPMRYQMVKNVLDRQPKRVASVSVFDPDLG